MRTIDHHRARTDETLTITVVDEPGPGGACHRYEITGYDTQRNASNIDRNGHRVDQTAVTILFQQGGIPDNGVNGITVEALLAICIDRLLAFQSGPYPCDENREALAHTLTALEWLKMRTFRRSHSGIEGKPFEEPLSDVVPAVVTNPYTDGQVAAVPVPLSLELDDEVSRLLEKPMSMPLRLRTPAPEVTQVTPEEMAAAVGDTYTAPAPAPAPAPWSPSEPQPIEADLIPANPPEIVPVEVDELSSAIAAQVGIEPQAAVALVEQAVPPQPQPLVVGEPAPITEPIGSPPPA